MTAKVNLKTGKLIMYSKNGKINILHNHTFKNNSTDNQYGKASSCIPKYQYN